MATDWEKIIGTVSNIFTAGSNIYATTVIAQAKVGLFDTQKKRNQALCESLFSTHRNRGNWQYD